MPFVIDIVSTNVAMRVLAAKKVLGLWILSALEGLFIKALFKNEMLGDTVIAMLMGAELTKGGAVSTSGSGIPMAYVIVALVFTLHTSNLRLFSSIGSMIAVSCANTIMKQENDQKWFVHISQSLLKYTSLHTHIYSILNS